MQTELLALFQSPRSGKFVSDLTMHSHIANYKRFNPLDRGNLYQMRFIMNLYLLRYINGFNPLDRGNCI